MIYISYNKQINNLNSRISEFMKQWILGLRKISKNAEEINRRDIRSFMLWGIIKGKSKGGV